MLRSPLEQVTSESVARAYAMSIPIGNLMRVPASRPDPLGDYLASLQRTIDLAPRIVYPGHGEPIHDPAGRARELITHHRERLDVAQAALGPEPRTGYDASFDLFGRTLSSGARRFAVAETLSHLERLRREGRAERIEADGVVRWSR